MPAETVAAVIGAATALFVAACAALTARDHAVRSVTPHIRATFDQPQGALDLANEGIGPAVLRRFQVQLHGRTFELEDPKALRKMIECALENSEISGWSDLNWSAHFFEYGGFIAAGQSLRIFSTAAPKKPNHREWSPDETRSLIESFEGGSRILIEYYDVYGRAFETRYPRPQSANGPAYLH